MNDIVPQNQAPNPFAQMAASRSGVNEGSVAIESQRAVAEAQGKLTLAKKFPRDVTAAHTELMAACQQMSLATVAFYKVPRGQGNVTGPSIRLAEEIARCWGNIQYGHKELSRSEGKSEVEVFAWDMQTNLYASRQLTVMHVMDTKDGPRKLRDQKDIDDKISNVASKQLRGRIMAILPKWLTEAAQTKCRETAQTGGSDKPIQQRIRDMAAAFAAIGVTTAQLAAYLEHPLENTTGDDLVDLLGVYTAIGEGAKVADYFDMAPVAEKKADTGAGINAIAAGAPPAPAPSTAPATAAATAPVTRRTRAAAAPAAVQPPPPPPPNPDDDGPQSFDDDDQGQASAPPPPATGFF